MGLHCNSMLQSAAGTLKSEATGKTSAVHRGKPGWRGVSACLAVLALLGACRSEPVRTRESELILGTAISVTMYASNPDPVFRQIFARVREIEAKMSTNEDDYESTELLVVNRAAGQAPVTVSPDTYEVVEAGLRYSRRTNGRFDVTVGPLVDLWGIGTEGAAVPDPGALSGALSLVDYREVTLVPEETAIYLSREGMGVDVGGIAKGYAADEAARILRENGIDSALLDFGGNIMTIGRKPDDVPWRIGLQIPRTDAPRGRFLGIVEATDISIVTSGTYERYFFEDGEQYHHILDTDTGYPVRNQLDSVTIVTEQSMRADALSTAVFAMGLEEGLSFVEAADGVEAIFVTSDRRVYTTSGVGDWFELTGEDYRMAQPGPTDRAGAEG